MSNHANDPNIRAGRGAAPAMPAGSATVTVRGDGIVGCAVALSLARLGIAVQLQGDSRPATAAPADVRTYALNAASRPLLQHLNVWDALPPQAVTAVLDMPTPGHDGAPPAVSAGQQGF